jgi:hypothetical protein
MWGRFQVSKLSSKKSGDIDAKLLEGDVRKEMFPAGIEPGQLIEIARALAKLDTGSDVVKLRRLFGAKTDEIERLINASLLLGFARIQNGLILITERVKEVNSLPRSKKRQYLIERLSLVEPFRTALEIAGKSKEFSSDKVAGLLGGKRVLAAPN